MTFDIKKVKIITTVPSNYLDKIREAAGSAGAGAGPSATTISARQLFQEPAHSDRMLMPIHTLANLGRQNKPQKLY